MKLFTVIIFSIALKAGMIAQSSRKWLTITNTVKYCTTEFITSVKELWNRPRVYRTVPPHSNKNWQLICPNYACSKLGLLQDSLFDKPALGSAAKLCISNCPQPLYFFRIWLAHDHRRLEWWLHGWLDVRWALQLEDRRAVPLDQW